MGPTHTLGGTSVEITWQRGRLDDKYSKSYPDASSHPEAESLQKGNLHPEADAHPEVNVLELALGILKLKSIRQRVQEPDCTMFRNVSYFSEVFCAE